LRDVQTTAIMPVLQRGILILIVAPFAAGSPRDGYPPVKILFDAPAPKRLDTGLNAGGTA